MTTPNTQNPPKPEEKKKSPLDGLKASDVVTVINKTSQDLNLSTGKLKAGAEGKATVAECSVLFSSLGIKE